MKISKYGKFYGIMIILVIIISTLSEYFRWSMGLFWIVIIVMVVIMIIFAPAKFED